MATMRKASRPSRSVMTNAWSMALSAATVGRPDRRKNETQSQNVRDSLPSGYPTSQVRYGDGMPVARPWLQMAELRHRPVGPATFSRSQFGDWLMRTPERGLAGAQSRRQPRADRDDPRVSLTTSANSIPDVLVIVAGVNDFYRGSGAEAVGCEPRTRTKWRKQPGESFGCSLDVRRLHRQDADGYVVCGMLRTCNSG